MTPVFSLSHFWCETHKVLMKNINPSKQWCSLHLITRKSYCSVDFVFKALQYCGFYICPTHHQQKRTFPLASFFKVGTKGTSQLDPKSFPSALLFVQPLWVWVESGDKLAWWKISLCQQKFNRLKFCVGIYFFVDSTFNRTVVVCLQITSIHLSVKREDWSKSFGSNVLTAMTRSGIKPFRSWRGVW